MKNIALNWFFFEPIELIKPIKPIKQYALREPKHLNTDTCFLKNI